MSFHRGIDGSDPVDAGPAGRATGGHVHLRPSRSSRLATGTLACPRCDAPVALAGRRSPANPLACPYCDHSGAVRDFLSLAAPSRPARVAVHVIMRQPRRATADVPSGA